MNQARKLAEAVRDALVGSETLQVRIIEIERLIADVLSAPDPQPSATVVQIRDWLRYCNSQRYEGPSESQLTSWADELEAAERRISELELKIKHLPRSDKGMFDECHKHNKNLQARIADLELWQTTSIDSTRELLNEKHRLEARIAELEAQSARWEALARRQPAGFLTKHGKPVPMSALDQALAEEIFAPVRDNEIDTEAE